MAKMVKASVTGRKGARSSQFGYVYVLTNGAIKDAVKIGNTQQPPTRRAHNLNTGALEDFEVYGFIRTKWFVEVEGFIKSFLTKFTDLRVNANREFYRLSPDMGMKAVEMVARLAGDYAVIPMEQINRKYPDGEIRVLCGSGANAVLVVFGGKYYVIGGSRVGSCVPKFSGAYCDLRKKLVKAKTIKSEVFVKDVAFDSLSAAASVVMGRQSNGVKEWRPV